MRLFLCSGISPMKGHSRVQSCHHTEKMRCTPKPTKLRGERNTPTMTPETTDPAVSEAYPWSSPPILFLNPKNLLVWIEADVQLGLRVGLLTIGAGAVSDSVACPSCTDWLVSVGEDALRPARTEHPRKLGTQGGLPEFLDEKEKGYWGKGSVRAGLGGDGGGVM